MHLTNLRKAVFCRFQTERLYYRTQLKHVKMAKFGIVALATDHSDYLMNRGVTYRTQFFHTSAEPELSTFP